MNRRLGLAQPGKQLLGALLTRLSQPGTVDQTVDVGERPVHVVMLLLVGLGMHVTMALVMLAVIVLLVATVIVCVVQRSVLALDAELRRRDASARHPLGPCHGWRNRQAAERPPDVLELHASIDQRAEDHVSSRTSKAIEVQDLHNLSIVPAYPDLRG